MEITDPSTRITLTAFQLVGRASAWWNSLRGAGGAEGLSWERFKEQFRDHFFPQSLRDAKREEFTGLIQGSMTVLEYERKFSDLSKYAQELISTSHLKCRRFERGLRPALRNKMVLLGLEDYEMLINRAMTVERDLTETKSIVEGRRGRSTGPQQESGGRKRFKGSSSVPQTQMSYQESNTPRPPRRQETQGQIICFNCRRPGHKSTECPKARKQGESSGSVRGGPPGETRQCYGCGQAGHILKFCPQAQGGMERRRGPAGQQLPGSQSFNSQSVQQQFQQRGNTQGTAQAGTSQQPRGSGQGQRFGRPQNTQPQGRVYVVAQQEALAEPMVT